MVTETTMGGACNYALLFVLLLVVMCESRISDRRLCGDPKCLEPVSYAKTRIRYYSNAEGILSFKPGENVKIFSKSAGSVPDLWGVEIEGKRGYAPKAFLEEYKVLKKNLQHEVLTEEELLSAGAQDLNLLHKSNSDTATGIAENEGSASPKESRKSNSEHAPLLPSNEDDSREVSKGVVGEEKTEDKLVSFQDDIAHPFELLDGTTIYLPSDEDSQAEPLPIQATMTSSMFSSIQVEAVYTSVDSAPKLQPSMLSTQENIMKSSASSSSSSSSPISAAKEQILDEKQILTETEKNSDLYSHSSSLISEGSNLEEHKSVSEQSDVMENMEKPLKENLETKEGKQMAANEGEKRIEDETEDEEDEDDYDYGDEYDDNEEEDESTSQITVNALFDESRNKVDSQNEKLLEYPTGNNKLPQNITVEEGKLSLEISQKFENSKEDITLVSDKSEDQRHVKSSAEEENLQFAGAKAEVKIEQKKTFADEVKPETNINTDHYHDYKKTDEHCAHSTEELSGNQKGSHDVEEVTSTLILTGHPALSGYKKEEQDINTVHSVNNILDINEHIEESTKEMNTSSSDNIDVQGNSSYTSSTEDLSTEAMNNSDTAPFVDELKNESSEIVSETDRNEGQEQSKYEKEKANKHLSEDVQPETSLYNAIPNRQKFSTENISPIKQETESDSTVDEISTEHVDSFVETADTDVKENIKQDFEIISEEQYSSGLFSEVTNSFWSGFGSLMHIFVDGSEENFSESTGSENVNVEEAQKLQNIHETPNEGVEDEAVSYPWSELQPSSGSFARKEQTQTCTVGSKASVGIDMDCDAIGELSRVNKKTETDSLKSQVTGDFVNMDVQKSLNTILYLIITAATVLLFSLGHYYMEKKRRDSSLVAKINELEKALLVSSKECIILKDDLEATKEKLLSIENSSTDSIETVATLNIQLQEAKVANAALEEQVASLEKELEQATEAGLELNRMLTEFLSTQHGSESLMKSVEHLQKQLDSQQSTITTMTESLNVKNAENENLQMELKFANENIHSLQEELQKLTEKLHFMETEKMKIIQESADKGQEFQNRIEEVTNAKEEEISSLHFELQAVQDSVTELKDNLVTKESEIAVLQDCIKQMKNYDDGDDTLQALLDVGETKAELKLMTIERNTLLEKLQIEEDARKLLEDHVKVIKEEVLRLRESYEEAEKEKTEAQTRLEVLSNYFKEKETQLQKELGLQEAMCLQREGDATSTHERIKALQEEIENYNGELPSSSDTVDSNKDSLKKKKIKKIKRVRQMKGSQNEALKKEILDQERGLKSQISSLEKKAHENWIAARQAERKLEETKQEAGQLRNRLTVVEKNITNVSKNEAAILNDRMPADSNGDIGTSPIHTGIAALADSSSPIHYHDGLPSPPLPVMLSSQPLAPSSFMGMHPSVFIPPPPPPGAPFMPPPPPPLFPGDRRPPPLGRMSSPPPPRRYSSPPPPPTESHSTFSPYEHSPPPSPLSSDRLYRSPPPPINDSPSRFKHASPPPPLPHFSTRLPPHWDDPHGTPRSGFRPLPPPIHRDSPREKKVPSHYITTSTGIGPGHLSSRGSTLSSGHSSESLEKSSRHSGRV